MSTLPQHAQVVIIGSGIVGNSIVYHLAEHGWTDMVMIDKGPLPNPGGSTGHASNFIYPVDHNKITTELTVDSQQQYEKMGLNRTCGGFELARTEERVAELRRRVTSAKAWGVEAELVSPAEVKKRFPWVNEKVVKAGFWIPSVSVVDSLQAGTVMREHAAEKGALQTFPNTEVTDIQIEGGRVKAVVTARGTVTADYVIIACGVWGPKLARMAGAHLPLVPVVHQMIDAGPIPQFAEAKGEIEYPILRDMSTLMYERQAGNNLEIGSYAHRSILHEPEEIPSLDEAKLSPTEMPFTEEDFDAQMEDALELLPEMLDHDSVEIQYAINGLISVTPDGGLMIGELPEVGGLWTASAIWIKEGPAAGQVLAEWMTEGTPQIDPEHFDVARFYPYAKTRDHVRKRAYEGFPKTYGIVHPQEQWLSSRPRRQSPFYDQAKALGAVFYETAGWERPHWYECNRPLLQEYERQVHDRPDEWDRRWWSPIINAEHLAMRERVAMFDLSAFAVFDIQGAGALDYMQRLALAQMDKPVGKAIYTSLLNHRGGIKADLTVMRTGEQAFRVVTGGGVGHMDKQWFLKHLPADGSVQLHDRTDELATVGVWGPKARDLVGKLTDDDVSHEGFPFASCKEITLAGIPVWALRISYVGELGWELYVPATQGRPLWGALWEAGRPLGVVPSGIGVYGTTARLEKGYRLQGHELELDYDPVEAGIAYPKVKKQDFIGKEPYLKAREAEPPAATLCTLSVTDHRQPSSGLKRYMLGNEPVLSPERERITDAKGRPSYVTSAGAGPSVGKHLLLSYLPPEYAKQGQELYVEYFGEHYPVRVEVAGSTPLFDPQNERMKA